MPDRNPLLDPAPGDRLILASGQTVECIARDGDVLIVGQRHIQVPGVLLATWRRNAVKAMVLGREDLPGGKP